MKLNLSWMYSSTIHRINIHWLIYPACIVESLAMSAFIRTNKNDPGILGARVAFLRVLLLSEHWETLSWDLQNWRVMIFMRPLKESRFPDWDPDLNIISKFGRIKSHRCIRSKTGGESHDLNGCWALMETQSSLNHFTWLKLERKCSRTGNAGKAGLSLETFWVFVESCLNSWTFHTLSSIQNHLVDMGNSKPANKKLYKQGSNHVKTY